MLETKKEHDGKLLTKISGGEYVGRPLQMGKKHEDICVPYDCSLKGNLNRGGV